MLRFLGVYFTQSVVKEGVDVLKMVFIARNRAKTSSSTKYTTILVIKVQNKLAKK